MDKIDIAIATYNGEKYISEQLNSILNSNKFDILVNRIIISDDGSSDTTFEILQNFANEYECIEIFRNKNQSGIVGNFEYAISLCNEKYIILSDQDDYWYPEKLTILRNGIKELESRSKAKEPCLFFTDLEVVDKDLNVIHKSFFGIIKYDLNFFFKRNTILLTNIVPGCAMIFNNELKQLALPITKGIYLHDWWLLLLACYGGRVSFSMKPTFMYRQHQNNAIGVVKKTRFAKIKDLFLETAKQDQTYSVARDVSIRLNEYDILDKESVLVRILDIQNKSRFHKMRFALRNGIFFKTTSVINSFARNFRLAFLYLFRKS